MGDCCLLLIRAGEVIFRTTEMQHAFNFPLQLGTHSRDEPMKDAKRYDVDVGRGDVVVVGSDGLMDNLVRRFLLPPPSLIKLKKKEDSLTFPQFDEDILDSLAQFAPPSSAAFTYNGDGNANGQLPTPPTSRPPSPLSLPPFSPQKVSEALCRRAQAVSEQTSATTPFMVRAIDEGIDFVGGKKDGESWSGLGGWRKGEFSLIVLALGWGRYLGVGGCDWGSRSGTDRWLWRAGAAYVIRWSGTEAWQELGGGGGIGDLQVELGLRWIVLCSIVEVVSI